MPDSSGNGFGATAYGDVSWVSGRGARVARLDGAGEVSVPRAVLRTDQSYTVAAWVRLTDGAKHATAVSQDGERASSFYLQFNGDSKRWGFACPIQDADLAVGIHAQSAEPAALHTWTHLTGVYDAAAAEVRLYVNGKLVASRAYHGAWQGNGPLRIGRAKWIGNAHDWWRGEISDVVAVTGVLPESEIRRLAE